MARVFDKAATIALLAEVKDGDEPLEPGDEFHHPVHGPVVVSKVYGWEDGHQLTPSDGHYRFVPVRVLVISMLRPGRKKAQKLNLLPAKVSA